MSRECLSALGQSYFRKGGACRVVDRLFTIHTTKKPITRLTACLHSQSHILQCGKSGKHRSDLKGSGQPELRALVDRQCGDVDPVEPDGPGRRCEQAGNLVYQRGFAGSVRSDDRMQFTCPDVERHAVGYDEAAEVFMQVIELKYRVRHGQAFREFCRQGRATRRAQTGQ